MADVYLALFRGPVGFRKLVVVKRLRADVANEEAFRSMLLDEARLAARLHHPNVVQTLEVGDHEGEHFIAMEYLEGQPLGRVALAAIRAGTPVSYPLAARMAIEILTGLHYAHELQDYDGTPIGIVHRDVSPQNVFVTYDGEIKLVDFGIARATLSTQETAVGVMKGKPSYMAPEQVRGETIDRRADIFAAGIVLWELLARRRLFRAGSPMGAVHQLLFEEIPRLDTIVPDIDPALDEVCRRALSKAPEERYATAAEMRAELERYLDRAPERPPGREEFGEMVARLFAKERAAIREQIGACMRAQDEQDVTGAGTMSSLPTLNAPLSVDTTPQPGTTPLGYAPPGTAATVRLPMTIADTPKARRRERWGGIAAVIALTLVGIGAVTFTITALRRRSAAITTPTDAMPAAAEDDVVLRLCGSNTIGAELAPALTEAFFRKKGATNIVRGQAKKSHGSEVRATIQGRERPQVVTIEAEGSATAFSGLAAGTCEIGMASRPIHDDEVKLLDEKGFGDMRAPASEHVIALDGIAVVVNPNNRIRSLDAEQLKGLFAGTVHDWSAVGGAPGPVNLFARDDASGTYDTFKHLVLGSAPLAASARRFADSDALSDAVANDPGGIGFIGLAYVRSAKALAVADRGAVPMFPSAFTVTTEGYFLSRRLYFYTSSTPSSPLVRELVSFALSPDGQAAARTAGFVDLSVGLFDPEPCGARCTARYAATVKNARRMSLDFRFRSGGNDIDSRGTRDLDRVVAFLHTQPGSRVLLMGFSDGVGDPATNLRLSRERARVVGLELAARGVHASVVEGFGSEMPVASNADDGGRQRNRRVEVWLAPM